MAKQVKILEIVLKTVALLISAIVFFFLHRFFTPICGFEPGLPHPRCASWQSDVFLGLSILSFAVLLFLIIRTGKARK